MSVFSDRLLSQINESGISQKMLAQKTEITPATISRYVTGQRNPTAENVNRIAAVLNVSVDYLLGRTNKPNMIDNIKEYTTFSTLGDNLRSLRESKNLTQKQIAEELNISASTVGMYEQNRRAPDNQTLSAFASIFNVSVDYLLGRKDRHIDGGTSPMLKILREGEGLTQQQLADKIGINLDEYITFENRTAKPSKDILNRLSDELNAPPDFIWGAIDTDDEDYQKRMMFRHKYTDDKILEEFDQVLNRDSIVKLLRQVGHYPDSEIFRIMNIITALELEKHIPGSIIEEIDLEE